MATESTPATVGEGAIRGAEFMIDLLKRGIGAKAAGKPGSTGVVETIAELDNEKVAEMLTCVKALQSLIAAPLIVLELRQGIVEHLGQETWDRTAQELIEEARRENPA